LGGCVSTSNLVDVSTLPVETWGPDGQWLWMFGDTLAGDGGGTSGDLLLAESIQITATPERRFTIRIAPPNSPGLLGNGVVFDNQAPSSWRLAQVCNGGTIVGFDPEKFAVDPSGFPGFLGGGSFSVSQGDGYLSLDFTPHTCSPSDFSVPTAPASPAWLVLSADPSATPPRSTALIYLKFENPYGIKNIVGLRFTNCTMTAKAYGSNDVLLAAVSSVLDGWTNPGVNDALREGLPEGTIKVVAIAAPVDTNAVFSCNAQVESLCGTSALAQIDPVVTLLEVTTSGVVRQVFERIPAFERYVSVENREPGLRNLAIVVNGQVFSMEGLRPGESRMVDVGEAMLTEEDNRIELIGEGELGAMAQVTIADSPVRAQTASGAAVYLTVRWHEGGLRLSWPSSASQWILQGRGSLREGGDWRTVAAEPVWLDGRWQVDVAPESELQWFRLIQRAGF
ncbi:MAG: hypothetical protein ACKO3N_12730, partial [Verrucomicrobiota bacterium]